MYRVTNTAITVKPSPPTGYDPELTACRLACATLGLAPKGNPWQGPEPTICAMDASPIRPGDLFRARKNKLGPNFMDVPSLVPSPYLSGYAVALMPKPVFGRISQLVIGREAAYPLVTAAARAWFFTDPPEPPFVAVISGSDNAQHLIWRTPLCWSREDIVFRLGSHVMRVRRQRLLRAMDDLNACKPFPFLRLSRPGNESGHGVLKLDTPPEVARKFADLTPGELVALAVLAKPSPYKPVPPQKPAPFSLTHEGN